MKAVTEKVVKREKSTSSYFQEDDFFPVDKSVWQNKEPKPQLEPEDRKWESNIELWQQSGEVVLPDTEL